MGLLLRSCVESGFSLRCTFTLSSDGQLRLGFHIFKAFSGIRFEVLDTKKISNYVLKTLQNKGGPYKLHFLDL